MTAIMTISTATTRAIADMGTESRTLHDRLTGQLARWRSRGLGIWPALWLVLCLLLAQQAGLTHRVVHGGLLNLSQAAAALSSTSDASDTSDTSVASDATDADHAEPLSLKLGLHSCVLFDGATIADSHVDTFTLPLLAFGKPVKPASLAWRWPDLPAARPFHTRAPPASPVFV